jgi:spermidine synthase
MAFAICLGLAIGTRSGAGHTKAYGRTAATEETTLVEIAQGAHATTAVIDWKHGRALLIDGFTAALQLENDNYMDWMGRLPMLLHPNPQSALVIAFGTGQTSHAVRDENPKSLDIVDINPDVFRLAHHFDSNHNVLNDPRVNHIVMDGRAWLRRTTKMYDVVTLEPMPPNFAGTNALYSKEFYEIMSRRLNPGAVVAQWLPIHIVTPQHSVAIAAAFQSVFKKSIAWKDPRTGTLILLGRYGDADEPFGKTWPGFARNPDTKRKLNESEVRGAVLLDTDMFDRFAHLGGPVTDDNQILAYGRERIDRYVYSAGAECTRMNLALIAKVQQDVR